MFDVSDARVVVVLYVVCGWVCVVCDGDGDSNDGNDGNDGDAFHCVECVEVNIC